MDPIVAAIVVVVFSVLSFLSGIYRKKSDVMRDQSLSYYEKTYLRETGYAVGYGNYNLQSFDGGKSWYAIEVADDGTLEVLGFADEVFPGLRSHIHAMDALIRYAEVNGPLTLSGPRAQTDRALLEASGFTVTRSDAR